MLSAVFFLRAKGFIGKGGSPEEIKGSLHDGSYWHLTGEEARQTPGTFWGPRGHNKTKPVFEIQRPRLTNESKNFQRTTAAEDVLTESNHSTKCSTPIRLCLNVLRKSQSRENIPLGERFLSSP